MFAMVGQYAEMEPVHTLTTNLNYLLGTYRRSTLR